MVAQKISACHKIYHLMVVCEEKIAALNEINFCSANEKSLRRVWRGTKRKLVFWKVQLAVQENKKDFAFWLRYHLEMASTGKGEKCAIHIKHDTENALQFYLEIKKTGQWMALFFLQPIANLSWFIG